MLIGQTTRAGGSAEFQGLDAVESLAMLIGQTTPAGGSAEGAVPSALWAMSLDRESDARLWECRGRQPFAGARGVLASSFLPAAAGGKTWRLQQPWEKIKVFIRPGEP